MPKAGESLLRGAREALDYARGTRKGYVLHAPQREADRKSTRLNSSHSQQSRMPSSA